MKKKLVILALVLATLACNTILPSNDVSTLPTAPFNPQIQSDTGIPQTEDDVPRISVSEAKTAVDSGAAILVDVRDADRYAQSHAIGAISIPLENFENNVGNLSLEKTDWIITYCT